MTNTVVPETGSVLLRGIISAWFGSKYKCREKHCCKTRYIRIVEWICKGYRSYGGFHSHQHSTQHLWTPMGDLGVLRQRPQSPPVKHQMMEWLLEEWSSSLRYISRDFLRSRPLAQVKLLDMFRPVRSCAFLLISSPFDPELALSHQLTFDWISFLGFRNMRRIFNLHVCYYSTLFWTEYTVAIHRVAITLLLP